MKQRQSTFMTSVAAIFSSQLLIKLIGFLYNIVLMNIPGFGDLGNGYRTAGYQIYTVLLAISSVGIPNAISKLISERLALKDEEGAEHVFRTALRLFAVIGAAASLLLFVGAEFLATKVIRISGVELTLRALSPSIFFVCVSSVMRGYFLGHRNVHPSNRSQILEQIFKATLTVLFVWLLTETSALIMAVGANGATSVSTAVSFLYLTVTLILYRRRNPATPASRPESGERRGLIRKILSLSIPISLSSIITSVARVIDTATISRGISKAFASGIPGQEGIPTQEALEKYAALLSGRFFKADNITNIVLALNIAFATVLVPTIAAALAVGDKKTASRRISSSFLLSILIVLPCSMGLILLAEPFFKLVYPAASQGADLMQWAAVALIFTALDQTICGSLQGLGRVYVPAVGLLCGAAVKYVLNRILIPIPTVGIYGAAVSSVACHLTAFIICFAALRRSIPMKLNFSRYVIKPVLCTAVMSLVTWGSYRLCMLVLHSNLVSLAASVLLSVAVYAVCVFTLHILSPSQIRELPAGDAILLWLGGSARG